MAPRRDIGTDDPRVRVRPGRGSRPRTKRRPDYSDAPRGSVTSVDRGRYRVITDAGIDVVAVKAREIPSVVIGDRVALTSDLSGKKDTLARIVEVDERKTALSRSAEDGETTGKQRVIVANADQLLIVTALADPPPRPGMIDRCIVAAYDAGMEPILCLTKSDLTSDRELRRLYEPLDLRICTTAIEPDGTVRGLPELRELLAGHRTVLIGHSGVGKSSLVNELVPSAQRRIGDVNVVTGRGRHTSTSAVAFRAEDGTWIIDTPGVRSFGLAHVEPDDILRGFDDLLEVSADCPRGCEHRADSLDCALTDYARTDERAASRVDSYRRLLAAREAALPDYER
ncbi:ribosome small subunit-dependent GTPase A [Bowdeniella nasicola]|uniref:Small ribosomal subunit biogenesis GTPase RsgA n=1 Tax=Bowdeniella nasicola TaxID=208480 RepID=A0A1Q5PZS5_9ACTO|nr:ribosome small subunit-dependent GTPase A [Bowdeniella nasicola]OKL52929.1 ribosome small subunit-dependent GTPase A [Bowdeniella nasicola]